jgi:hypothetical protein
MPIETVHGGAAHEKVRGIRQDCPPHNNGLLTFLRIDVEFERIATAR